MFIVSICYLTCAAAAAKGTGAELSLAIYVGLGRPVRPTFDVFVI